MVSADNTVRDTSYFEAIKDIRVLSRTLAERIDRKAQLVEVRELNSEALSSPRCTRPTCSFLNSGEKIRRPSAFRGIVSTPHLLRVSYCLRSVSSNRGSLHFQTASF